MLFFQLVSHAKLMYLWHDQMIQVGFAILVRHMSPALPAPVRQACGMSLRTLSVYPEFTQLTIQHVLPAITEFKGMTTTFQVRISVYPTVV